MNGDKNLTALLANSDLVMSRNSISLKDLDSNGLASRCIIALQAKTTKVLDLWFANIRFADSGLTFISIWPKNRGLCRPSPCSCFGLRNSSLAVMRPWRRRMRLFAFKLAAFQRQRRRPVLTSLDPLFWVGLSLRWKRLALSPYVRPSRHVPPLAARAISQILGTFIEKEPASPRQTRDGRRHSTSD